MHRSSSDFKLRFYEWSIPLTFNQWHVTSDDTLLHCHANENQFLKSRCADRNYELLSLYLLNLHTYLSAANQLISLGGVQRNTLPPICTHNIVDDGIDPVLCSFRRCQLFNDHHDRVKVKIWRLLCINDICCVVPFTCCTSSTCTWSLLSPHADRHAGDIMVTAILFVFLFVCLSARYLVTDISGVGWRRAMKFCRMVDLGG